MNAPVPPPVPNVSGPAQGHLPVVVPGVPEVLEAPPASVRVLHLINGEHYAGAERVQDLLALALPERGFETGFACLKPERFPPMRRSQQTRLEPLPMRSRLDGRVIWAVARTIRRHRYRLLHAHTPRGALVGRLAASLVRVPMVYHVHSPASRDTTDRWRNRINALVERWGMGGAARLIAVSASLARHLESLGSDRGRIRVVPNGVPEPQRRRSAAPPAPPWTLGTVALFRPRKGLEILLDALAILRHQRLPFRLRAVGSFETAAYQREIQARAGRVGVADLIQWTGFRSDVEAELAGMDLLVLPSLFGEGLPMVVLEAMAAGVPVVASHLEGVPEAVRHGREGLLVRPGDPDDLAAAVGQVIQGHVDWQQLHRNARQRHALHFSDKTMAAGVAAVYRELLGLAEE